MRIKDANLFEGFDLMSPDEQVNEFLRISKAAVEKKFKNIDQLTLTKDDILRIADECFADIMRDPYSISTGINISAGPLENTNA